MYDQPWLLTALLLLSFVALILSFGEWRRSWHIQHLMHKHHVTGLPYTWSRYWFIEESVRIVLILFVMFACVLDLISGVPALRQGCKELPIEQISHTLLLLVPILFVVKIFLNRREREAMEQNALKDV